ncbi:glycoside hydrolase family 76 protein [Aneurinibacillus sp. Ricciae_BoGa-3]|uniref:glycoside hydrolase family 76 protein n=1 Tax=Aneurinibacillus sp. Ricciae_BoGa-3 TaxID=3022697 RepID=UPI002340DB04|nr:glycoside hydrolase family 76 protein [Aneurinibacillus sp. Ricciae_BoGa-3]WCK56611.1 glycoside hydrolase family 76 protein [Aneurinibacillus sp. Ricciae_BoGa-3]
MFYLRKLAIFFFASVLVIALFPVAEISSTSSISMSPQITKAATISPDTKYNTYAKNAVSALQAWYNPATGLWNHIGWWALSWIKAYDVTHDIRYLTMAKTIFKDMTGGWDSTYGSGIWWNKDRNYKNAIANELFLTVAAKLHLRTPGDKSYLAWSQKEWNWFKGSGMINAQHLINDGLDKAGHNNGGITWTYNQGVILAGLVDLFKSTGNASYLASASLLADSAMKNL